MGIYGKVLVGSVSMIYRTVLSYLRKKAAPGVSLKPTQFPDNTSLGRNDEHKAYWKFIDDHRIELSQEEYDAVNAYRHTSTDINHHIRGTFKLNEEDAKEVEKHLPHLDRAIQRSTINSPVTLWRGIDLNKGEPITEKLRSLGLVIKDRFDNEAFRENIRKPDLDKLVGFRFKEPGFSSTSLSPSLWKFSSIRLRILLDRGQCGLSTNSAARFDKTLKDFFEGTEHLHGAEHEVLLPRNTVFKVESANFDFNGKGQFLYWQLFLTLTVVD